MKKINNIFYTENNTLRQMLDLYLPDYPSFPVFVYFHGGGLERGSKDDKI